MASLDMHECNQGNSPTFIRGKSEMFIDVIFGKLQIVDRICDWRVLEEESLSLLNYISFEIAHTTDKQNLQ